MDKYDLFITFVITIKLIFIFMSTTHIYLVFKGKSDSNLDKKIVYWKKRTEFIFVLLISLLMIYLFNPYASNLYLIKKDNTKFLLYMFGFLLLITADWQTFIHEATWFKILQNISGRE